LLASGGQAAHQRADSMAYELFYTSAPRGLRPQTSGICTVGLTQGFPAPFIPRIEALSGYRKPNDAADPAACPVAFSHWIVEGGGVTRHVLSAVRLAPPDHTGRSNKFAHHLLLREEECGAAGPAWLLQQEGVVVDSWTGEPRELPHEKRMPSAGRVMAGVCTAWQRASGDAGWAGVLANAAMLDPTKACSVIVAPRTNALALIAEALLLLPAELRWRVTFTSYFMEPIAGVRCSWRFCLDGTPAAQAARAGGGTCIDLCAGAPCTRTGRFIDFARTGTMPTTRVPAAEPSVGAEGGTGACIELSPDKPADLDAVLGRSLERGSPQRVAINETASGSEHQRKVTVLLAACAAFFALLSGVLLLLMMQQGTAGNASPAPMSTAPAVPAKIPDSTTAPIQVVAQPGVTQVEAEVRSELLAAKDRISELERDLADARASRDQLAAQQAAADSASALPSPSPQQVSPTQPNSRERLKPMLSAAAPKAAMQDGMPRMPTDSGGWIVKSVPAAQKDSFGHWHGFDNLIECPEGASWKWVGPAERGGFGFDAEGITLRSTRPGAAPDRIAKMECVNGSLKLTWVVTSTIDASNGGWFERLKKEIEHMGLATWPTGPTGQTAARDAKWIRFSKVTSVTVDGESIREVPMQGVWQCAAAGGAWTDLSSSMSSGMSVSVPKCAQGGGIIVRESSRGSTNNRLWEVLFDWPANLSDDELARVKEAILEVKGEITSNEQALKMLGTPTDPETKKRANALSKEIAAAQKRLDAQESVRQGIEQQRDEIANCVQGKTFLFGPKDEVPVLELVVRLKTTREGRK